MSIYAELHQTGIITNPSAGHWMLVFEYHSLIALRAVSSLFWFGNPGVIFWTNVTGRHTAQQYSSSSRDMNLKAAACVCCLQQLSRPRWYCQVAHSAMLSQAPGRPNQHSPLTKYICTHIFFFRWNLCESQIKLMSSEWTVESHKGKGSRPKLRRWLWTDKEF